MAQSLATYNFTISLSRSGSFRKSFRSDPTVQLHSFYSTPSTWASSLGFSKSSHNEWLSICHNSKDATVSNSCDPLLGYPQVAILQHEWGRASHLERLDKIPSLRLMAQKAASYNLRVVSSDFLAKRKKILRRSDISKWARIIKPATKVPFGFSASWFTPPDGPPRRPLTAEEAHKGAVQEWSKLMVEPSCKWHHPLITQYKDEWGRPRGTINLEVACNASPGDNTRDIAQAYMGSPESGYSIVYWS